MEKFLGILGVGGHSPLDTKALGKVRFPLNVYGTYVQDMGRNLGHPGVVVDESQLHVGYGSNKPFVLPTSADSPNRGVFAMDCAKYLRNSLNADFMVLSSPLKGSPIIWVPDSALRSSARFIFCGVLIVLEIDYDENGWHLVMSSSAVDDPATILTPESIDKSTTMNLQCILELIQGHFRPDQIVEQRRTIAQLLGLAGSTTGESIEIPVDPTTMFELLPGCSTPAKAMAVVDRRVWAKAICDALYAAPVSQERPKREEVYSRVSPSDWESPDAFLWFRGLIFTISFYFDSAGRHFVRINPWAPREAATLFDPDSPRAVPLSAKPRIDDLHRRFLAVSLSPSAPCPGSAL